MWTDISKSMWTHIEIVLPFVYERDWVQNYVTESQFSWSQSNLLPRQNRHNIPLIKEKQKDKVRHELKS